MSDAYDELSANESGGYSDESALIYSGQEDAGYTDNDEDAPEPTNPLGATYRVPDVATDSEINSGQDMPAARSPMGTGEHDNIDDRSDISLEPEDDAYDNQRGPNGQRRPPRTTRISAIQQLRDDTTLQIYEVPFSRFAGQMRIVMSPVERWCAARIIRDDCYGTVDKEDLKPIFEKAREDAVAFKAFINRYWRWYKTPRAQRLPDQEYEWPPISEDRKSYVPQRHQNKPPERPTFRGHPVRSDQLTLISNWLADEDYFRCLDFVGKFSQIKAYMETVYAEPEGARTGEELRLIEEIRDMIAVHDDWLKDELEEKPIILDTSQIKSWRNDARIKPSSSVGNITANELRREAMARYMDTPLKLPVDKGPMRDALVTQRLTRTERPVEDHPYGYTFNMRDIHRDQQALVDVFQANEAALHHEDASYTPASKNHNGPYVAIPKSLVEERMAAQHGKLLGIAEKLRKAEGIATRPLLSNVIVQIQWGLVGDPAARTSADFQSLSDARAQRARLYSSARGPAGGNIVQPSFTTQDAKLLLVLAEPSWSRPPDALRFPDQDVGEDDAVSGLLYSDLVAFWQQLEQYLADGEVWPSPTTTIPFQQVVEAINAVEPGRYRVAFQDAEVFVDAIAASKRVNSFHGSASDGKVIHYIRKPVPGYHPERRFVPHGVPVDAAGLVQYDAAGNKGPPIPLAPDAMERTAFKLGRTIRHLTHAIAADANPAGEQAASMNRQNAFVADNVNTRNSTSLFDPVLGIRFNEGARERNLAKLQDKLIMECNRNWSQLNPEPDHARNWAFERELDDATRKDFFAFDRWPVEFQSPERQREIIHSVPWTAQVLPPRLGGHVDDGGRDDHHHHHHRLQRLAQARELRIRRRRHRHHHAGHHHDAHDADRDRFGDGHHLDDHHHHDDHHGHPRGTKRKADDQPVHGPPARVRWRDPRAPPTDGDNRRERYFRGQTVFPFGETPIQQAWQSMQIDNDLRDAPEFAHIYKTPWFKRLRTNTTTPARDALPPLPADWSPANIYPRPTDDGWKKLFTNLGWKPAEVPVDNSARDAAVAEREAAIAAVIAEQD